MSCCSGAASCVPACVYQSHGREKDELLNVIVKS